MFHQVDTVFNATTSKAIPGVRVQIYDNSGVIQSLYVDEGGTPIETVSGIADTAVTDDDGLYDFWVADGVYDIRFYLGDTLVRTLTKIALDGSAATEVTTKANAVAIGVSASAANMGAYAADSITDGQTAKQNIEEIGGQLDDLASTAPDKGASLVGTVDGGTVQGAVDNIEPTAWRKTPSAVAALKFPGYADALAEIGGTYLYPQGFDFDEDGNVYLNIASNDTGSATKSVVAVYDPDFNFLRYFYRPSVGSESIGVTGSSAGGDLKLFFAVSSNFIEYAPGTWPASEATLAAGTTRITGGCGSIFSFNEGKWLIQQVSPDLGISGSRTAFTYYDTDFNEIGRFYVAKNAVGWQTSSDASYPYVPKMQGITHKGGKVYIGVGGSYIPETAPDGPLRAADTGIIECSSDGSILQYAVARADLVMARIDSLGYSITRTESEGVAVGPDGQIYSLMITRRPSDSDADSHGILLIREMDMLGDLWDDIATPYAPADLSRYEGRVWPRAADGKMRSPVSGDEITTLSGLLDLMVELQLQQVSYYTAVHALTTVTGFPDASDARRIDLFNLNNSTFHARTTRTASPRIQEWFRLSGGPSWEAAGMSMATDVLFITDGVGAPATRAGQASIYIDTADGDLKVKFGDGTVKTIVADT